MGIYCPGPCFTLHQHIARRDWYLGPLFSDLLGFLKARKCTKPETHNVLLLFHVYASPASPHICIHVRNLIRTIVLVAMARA